MHTVYFRSLMARAPVVCGQQLRPYSIAHRFTLRSLNNPYAFGEPQDPLDGLAIVEAIEVCRRTTAELRAALSGGEWLKGLTWPAAYGAALSDEIDLALREYIANFTGAPESSLVDSPNTRTMNGCPEMHLAVAMAQHFRCTLDEAFDMPYGLSLCVNAIVAEKQGVIRLASDVEEFGHMHTRLAAQADDRAAAARAAGDEAGAKVAAAEAAELWAVAQEIFKRSSGATLDAAEPKKE